MSRTKLTSLLFLVPLAGTTACRVDPAKDYARTSQIIAERTNAPQTYSPQSHDIVADRVEQLLQDGLTINEAVEITLLHNPGFQSLFEEVGISRAEVVQSGLLNNPVLASVIKFPEAGGRVSLDLGMTQEIAQLWQIPVRRQIAKAKLEQTIAAVAQRGVELAAEAKTNYCRLRTRQLEEESIAASVEIVEESTRIVERQVKNGAASQLDLNLTLAAGMDVRLQLMAVRRQRESAEIELGRTLGLSPASYPRRLVDPLPGLEQLPQLDELIAYASEQRLDLLRARQALTAAEDEVIRQSILVFPSVVVGLALERPERQSLPGRNLMADTARSSIQNGGLAAPDIATRGQRDAVRRQFIDFLIGPSFQVTLPLFDQNQAQIAIAGFRVRQRQKDYRDLLTRAESEIAQSLSALRVAHEQSEFYRTQAIPIAEANEKGSQSVFKSGAQTILILLEAQRSLIDRRRAYVVVQGDCGLARVDLERVVGGRLPATASMQPSTAPAENTHE